MPRKNRSWDAIMADIARVDGKIKSLKQDQCHCILVMVLCLAWAFVLLLTLGVFK